MNDCLLCGFVLGEHEETFKFWYYLIFATLFNVFWALVFVASMALIVGITYS